MSDEVTRALKTLQVESLESAYVQCLDEDRLEAWPDFFTDDGVYKIIPRENADRNLPIALISCHNKAQLRDRIVLLREALIYTKRIDSHIVSNVRLTEADAGTYRVSANYVVHVTDRLEGTTELFSAGRYDDEVVFVNGEPKFKQKLVISDTFSITNNLTTPL